MLLDKAGRPKVTDFGLAKGAGVAAVTRSGDVMGTPGYMASEQARAQNKLVGPPTDVYALGVILYECLTGRVPFTGDDPIDVLMQVAEKPPTRVRQLAPDVPPALERICLKCLTKDQADRYPTAGHLADELRRFLDDVPLLAEPPTRRLRAFPVGQSVFATALLIAAGVGVWRLTRAPATHTGADHRADPVVAAEPPPSVTAAFASSNGEWGPPAPLGDGVNTAEKERMPTLSRDELTLVYDRGNKLFITRRTTRTDPFPLAQLLPDVVNDLKPSFPSLSGDGLLLAFNTVGAPGQHVWISQRAAISAPFGPPERVPDPTAPSQWESCPCLSDDGLTLLLTSLPRRPNFGSGDILITRRKSRAEPFPAPEPLPAPVNSADHELAGWLSPDNLVLLRIVWPKGMQPEVCEYHWRKTVDEPFGPGTPFDPFPGSFHLGKPWLSPDGRRMYFHARPPGGPTTNLDLWVSELQPRGTTVK